MLVDTQSQVSPGGFGSNSIIIACEPLRRMMIYKCFSSFLTMEWLHKHALAVVYFEQLSGSASTWKLVETCFSVKNHQKISKINKEGWKQPKEFFDQLSSVWAPQSWLTYTTIGWLKYKTYVINGWSLEVTFHHILFVLRCSSFIIFPLNV